MLLLKHRNNKQTKVAATRSCSNFCSSTRTTQESAAKVAAASSHGDRQQEAHRRSKFCFVTENKQTNSAGEIAAACHKLGQGDHVRKSA